MSIPLIILGIFLIVGLVLSICAEDYDSQKYWRVLYNDGKYSILMPKQTATDYASIFGGSVIYEPPQKGKQ